MGVSCGTGLIAGGISAPLPWVHRGFDAIFPPGPLPEKTRRADPSEDCALDFKYEFRRYAI